MLYRKIMAVAYERRTKHMNVECGQKAIVHL
jgi:hypothetical protein